MPTSPSAKLVAALARTGTAVYGGAVAAAGGERLARVGIINNADFDLAGGHEGDRYTPCRDSLDEALGAVDGIDHPQARRLAGFSAAAFLAQEAVAGKAGLEAVADQRFDLAVGLGGPVLGALVFDLQGGAVAEIARGQIPGLAGGGEGGVEANRQRAGARAGGHDSPAPSPGGNLSGYR